MNDFDPAAARVRWGLPKEALAGRRLVFDPSSETLLLAGTAQVRGELPQLYYRRLSEDRYENFLGRVAPALPTKPAAPIITTWVLGWDSTVFCAIADIGGEVSASARALNYIGLAAVNLRNWSCHTWESVHGFRADVALSELIGVDVERRALYGIAALRAGEPRRRVPYHVVRMDWEKGSVEKVGPLEAIFF